MLEPKPSQRAAHREATRRKILSIARNTLLKAGGSEVTMDEIAQDAGLGRATVYMHFPGKQALLEALLLEDWDGQAKLFARLGAEGPPSAEAIEIWLKRVVDGMKRARASFALHRIALSQEEGAGVLHRGHRQRLAALLRESLIGTGNPTARACVDSLMIVAEIEYLATAAALEWRPEETAIAIALMTARIAAFGADNKLTGQ